MSILPFQLADLYLFPKIALGISSYKELQSKMEPLFDRQKLACIQQSSWTNADRECSKFDKTYIVDDSFHQFEKSPWKPSKFFMFLSP